MDKVYRNVYVLMDNPRFGSPYKDAIHYNGEVFYNKDVNIDKNFLDSKGYNEELDLAISCNCVLKNFSGFVKEV